MCLFVTRVVLIFYSVTILNKQYLMDMQFTDHFCLILNSLKSWFCDVIKVV